MSLTYSLVSPPAGASIHPSSGAFTWVPPAGPATVLLTVRVTDNGTPALSDTRHFTVTVLNVAPAAGVSGPSSGMPGQALSFTFTAADPSAVDQAAGFTYVINWGDGTTPQTVLGSGSVNVNHTYTATGAYVVQVSATDQDGGTGSAMLSPPVMIASEPGVSDLSWSDDGILAPPDMAAGESFTVGRTFVVGGEPVGPFAIAYWASVDDIFGNEDDFLVGTEFFAGAAPGIHSGTSPSFTIGTPGTYRLFAVLDSAMQIMETDEDNNVVMALATLLVT